MVEFIILFCTDDPHAQLFPEPQRADVGFVDKGFDVSRIPRNLGKDKAVQPPQEIHPALTGGEDLKLLNHKDFGIGVVLQEPKKPAGSGFPDQRNPYCLPKWQKAGEPERGSRTCSEKKIQPWITPLS